jgi:hypothetical protein
MFETLANQVPADRDMPTRAWNLTVLEKVLDGTIYDALTYQFHEEKTGAGEYVKVSDRKPSIRCGLCRTVVDDSVALLFGEGRFPAIELADKGTRETLTRLFTEANLPAVMTEAALRGSVGSVVVLLRLLEGKVYFSALTTKFLTPSWKDSAPDVLERVTERYKVRGAVLAASGYAIAEPDLAAEFWFQRVWDTNAETWFVPQRVIDAGEGKPLVVDTVRTTRHGLGFVPMVWIRNLPGGDETDGACTFRPAVETAIEVDYQLSQAGRGLKYSSDPTLLIKEPASDGPHVGGAANALVVSENGDAKLLEIGGTASAAVIEYVRALREMALESIHGNRSNADKISAAQSGRAMEMLHQPLIWIADRLRHSYGGGLLDLLKMLCSLPRNFPLKFRDGTVVPPLAGTTGLSLRWPAWFAQTEADRLAAAGTLATLVKAGIMSRETAARLTAQIHDLDAEDEVARLPPEPKPQTEGATP